MTKYSSVEAAAAYLNRKDINGRFTHELIKLGGLCAVCERPHNLHSAFFEESSNSLKPSVSNDESFTVGSIPAKYTELESVTSS